MSGCLAASTERGGLMIRRVTRFRYARSLALPNLAEWVSKVTQLCWRHWPGVSYRRTTWY